MSELQGLVNTVVTQTAGLPDPTTLAGWNPALSGDIDIHIRSDGTWEHEGSAIRREELVRLFASLLRREADGDYYLITPVEKWRIKVDRHPLVVIDCEKDSITGAWTALLNTGGRCQIGGEHVLKGSGGEGEPYLHIPSGLTAQISRAAWYRLVDEAREDNGELVLISAGERVSLGTLSSGSAPKTG